MDHLTVDDFTPLVSSPFTVRHGAFSWTFTLAEVGSRQSAPAGQRQPFALLFHGPATPVLPQAIYRFEHEALPPLDIFVVPVGPDGDRMRYEAIFS